MILASKDSLFQVRIKGKTVGLRESDVKTTSLVSTEKEADLKMVTDFFLTKEKTGYHTYIHLRDGDIKQAAADQQA